jgi:hypothetical protein
MNGRTWTRQANGEWEHEDDGYILIVSADDPLDDDRPWTAVAIWGSYPFPHDLDLGVQAATEYEAMAAASRWLDQRLRDEAEAERQLDELMRSEL